MDIVHGHEHFYEAGTWEPGGGRWKMRMPDKVDAGVTIVVKIAAIFLAGWFASSAYHTTLLHQKKAEALTTLQTQVIPKLASVAGCQTRRAQIATSEAVKANAEGSDVDIAAIPNCPKPSVPKIAVPLAK
jgi:hypothetical protein